MKKKVLWKALLFVGVCPFAAPVVMGAYRMSIEQWTWPDWLALYSFLYWPTYVVGLILIMVSLYKLFGDSSEAQ
ncbi:MAG: hypothetical protein J6A62_02510 [Oscillospiraceae bacterium]|nr:hypothetical protein [Oscillospiraceae bacterium]